MTHRWPTHGGAREWAEARYGPPPQGRWLDFSANIHPSGCPPRILEALRRALDRVALYPDPEAARTTAALARRLGVPAECVLLTNGGSQALYLALGSLRPGSVGVVQPCFAEYARAAAAVGATVRAVVAPPPFAWQAPPPGCECLVLGRPNNPTGMLPPPLQHPRVVWDEAFIDFTPAPGAATMRYRAARGSCIVVGSLTKLYGLAGLRAGYVVAEPGAIAAMARLQPAWSVNTLAQVAVEVACATAVDLSWLAPTRAALAAGLRNCGLRPFPSSANFLLVDCAPMSGQALCDRLGPRGILIRDAGNFPGLGPNYVRVAVRWPEENAQLLAAIRAATGDRRS